MLFIHNIYLHKYNTVNQTVTYNLEDISAFQFYVTDANLHLHFLLIISMEDFFIIIITCPLVAIQAFKKKSFLMFGPSFPQ